MKLGGNFSRENKRRTPNIETRDETSDLDLLLTVVNYKHEACFAQVQVCMWHSLPESNTHELLSNEELPAGLFEFRIILMPGGYILNVCTAGADAEASR